MLPSEHCCCAVIVAGTSCPQMTTSTSGARSGSERRRRSGGGPPMPCLTTSSWCANWFHPVCLCFTVLVVLLGEGCWSRVCSCPCGVPCQ